MGLYLAVARGSFRRYAAYRAANWGRLGANTAFGFILAYTYLALWNVRPHLGGYDRSAALTYSWLGQVLFVPVALYGAGSLQDLADRIRSGDVAIDLYRPADLQGWWLATDLGRFAFQLLGGLWLFGVGGLCFHLRLPQGGAVAATAAWLAALVSLALGIQISFALRYLVALVGFWVLDVRGAQMTATLLCAFLSGFMLPLSLFPSALATAAHLLPWQGMFQTPTDFFLQRTRGAGPTAAALGLQLAWAVALLALGRAVQRGAVRKVVIQGG